MKHNFKALLIVLAIKSSVLGNSYQIAFVTPQLFFEHKLEKLNYHLLARGNELLN